MNLNNILDVLDLMNIEVIEPTEIRKHRDDVRAMAGQVTVAIHDAAKAGEVINSLARVVDVALSDTHEGYQFTFLLNNNRR